ncbi:Sorting nexin-29 [Halotydeus destructor]|nr:Sorting nexin-29 [Halotydeus destructor]
MNQSVERQKLISNLLVAAKECLARFGGRSELATELDGRVIKLCTAIEDIFSHGLKSNRNLLKATKNAIVKSLAKEQSFNSEDFRSSLTFPGHKERSFAHINHTHRLRRIEHFSLK